MKTTVAVLMLFITACSCFAAVAKSGYEKLAASKYVDLNRPHTPFAIVRIAASGTCPEETAFRDDSQAAYATALMWVITGDNRYRDKCMAILNEWAAKVELIPISLGGTH